MPLYIPSDLPAYELRQKEGLDIEDIALKPASHTLKIALINLMPKKIETENDFIRLLSHSPLDVELTLVRFCSHQSKNTSEEHLAKFYKDFKEVSDLKYDGLIITGAPVENMPFEEVNYWKELQEVFEWSKIHAKSTLFICWAAQAALYHFHNIDKEPLAEKMFGVFEHHLNGVCVPLLKGFDDTFFVPHSRHTTVSTEKIKDCKDLNLLVESETAGAYLVSSNLYPHFFITGHSEYAPGALDAEYKRDITKGLDIAIPQNYYKANNPALQPEVRWRAHANLLFMNWVQYYVNQ